MCLERVCVRSGLAVSSSASRMLYARCLNFICDVHARVRMVRGRDVTICVLVCVCICTPSPPGSMIQAHIRNKNLRVVVAVVCVCLSDAIVFSANERVHRCFLSTYINHICTRNVCYNMSYAHESACGRRVSVCVCVMMQKKQHHTYENVMLY